MPNKQNVNLDEDLRQRVGHDATSSFESDPRFTDSNPTDNASSENIGVTASGAGDRLSGNTDRRANNLEDDDESEIGAGISSEDTNEEMNDETLTDIDADSDDANLDIDATDEEDVVSQDQTRLEGGSQSARGRDTRKSPRQAA